MHLPPHSHEVVLTLRVSSTMATVRPDMWSLQNVGVVHPPSCRTWPQVGAAAEEQRRAMTESRYSKVLRRQQRRRLRDDASSERVAFLKERKSLQLSQFTQIKTQGRKRNTTLIRNKHDASREIFICCSQTQTYWAESLVADRTVPRWDDAQSDCMGGYLVGSAEADLIN